MRRLGLHGASPWAIAAAMTLAAGGAWAQVAPPTSTPVAPPEVERPQPLAEADTAQAATEVEAIVVTGSLIRGATEDPALPVDVIGQEELERLGSPTVLELIKSLPVSNGVLGDTNQFDSRAQGSEGSGSVNLRGLGSNRTLVLLNGRRFTINPLGQAGAGIVDTNMIPSAAIGRIEVLKDGAAATYGSDAIAGVVNFITRENFEGLEIGGDYRYIDGSEGDWTLSANYGWQGDRADVFFSIGAQHRSELDVTERKFTQRSYAENPQGGYTAAGNPGSFLAFTSASPAAAVLFRDPGCSTLGGTPGFSGATPVCQEQYLDYDNLVEEENRIQAFGSINVELSDNHRFHAEALYGRTDVPKWETSPAYAILTTPSVELNFPAPGSNPFFANRFYVPATNPGLIDFVQKNPTLTTVSAVTGQTVTVPSTILLSPASGGAAIVAGRPFLLGGNPLFDNGPSRGKRFYDAFRVSGGFNGELPISLPGGSNLNYDVALTYSQQTGYRSGYDALTNRFALALRGLGGPNCDKSPSVPGVQGPGGGAATPGANGCLYFNPFSNAIQQNAIDGQTNPQYNAAVANENDALTDWFFRQTATEQTARLFVADAVVSGETGITLPGGPLQFAVGAQYRKDFFKADYDPINNSLISPCVASPDFFNDVCTGAQAVGPFVFLNGSVPSDLENDVYAVFSELQVPLTDDINIQLAARYEDYGGEVGSTFDPKISAKWQITDMLALRGSASSTFRGPPTTQLGQGSVTSLQSILGTFRAVDIFGNPGLEPESAQTYSAGVILDVGGFKGSIDYYRFDFENPIVAEPVGGIVNAVFPNGAAGANNCTNPAFAALVSRFTFNGACAPANIGRLRTNYVNGAPVKTSGLDFIGEYDFGDRFGGELSIGASATYVLEYNVDAQTVEGVVVAPAFEAVGFLNYQTTAVPIPEIKGQAYVEYERDIHNLRVTVNYIDSYVDQRVAEFATNAYRDPTGAPFTNTEGKTIDAFVTTDVTYRAFLPRDITFTATIDNLFDEDPSFARLDLSYDPFTGNPLGRTIKLGLRKTF